MNLQIYPRGITQPLDIETVWKKFGDFSLTGSINVPKRVKYDLRYRLIQLHEIMHAYHHKIQRESWSIFKAYLMHYIQNGRLKHGRIVPVVVFVTNDQIPSLVKANLKVLDTRENGKVLYGRAPEGMLASGMMLSQYNELFADFFSAAAGGAAYWATAFDLEHDDCEAKNIQALKSIWDKKYTNLFEPHPLPWVRLRLLPQIFCNIFAKTVVVPSLQIRDRILAEMQAQIDRHVLSKLPAIPDDAFVCYKNDSAPQEIRELQLAVQFLLPYYEVAFEAFGVLMTYWWQTAHPLALFAATFFNSDYHARIGELANQFTTGTPSPTTQLLDGAVERIASTAAARLCADENQAIDFAALQQRANDFIQLTKPGLIAIDNTKEESTGTVK